MVGVITGQGRLSAVIVPWDDLGPTKSPLSVPPAMIVYVTPHSSPLSVTVALPLVIGVLSVHTNVWISTCTYDTIRFNYITTYVHKFYNFTHAKMYIKDSIVNYVQYKDQNSEFMNSRPLAYVWLLRIIANNVSSMESGSPKICTSTTTKLQILVVDSEISYACTG